MVAVNMQCVTSAAGEGSGRGVSMIFMHGQPLQAAQRRGYWALLRSNLVATPMCLGLIDIIKLTGDESQHLTELSDRL